jgi:hypothetical protein
MGVNVLLGEYPYSHQPGPQRWRWGCSGTFCWRGLCFLRWVVCLSLGMGLGSCRRRIWAYGSIEVELNLSI